jgi:hypothetical protein
VLTRLSRRLGSMPGSSSRKRTIFAAPCEMAIISGACPMELQDSFSSSGKRTRISRTRGRCWSFLQRLASSAWHSCRSLWGSSGISRKIALD